MKAGESQIIRIGYINKEKSFFIERRRKKLERKAFAGLIVVVVAIIAIAMLAGCVEEKPKSTAEIKEMVLATAENTDTYQFEMDMTQKTLISNETDETEMTMTSTGRGAMDRTNKKMKLEMTMTIQPPEKAEIAETKEMTMDIYFINNTLYTKMDMGIPTMPSQWTKNTMPEEYWESQNQIDQQMELLNISKVELLGDEKVSDVDCYVLKLTPDLEKYWEIVMKQEGLSELMQSLKQNVSFDMGKLIKEMSIKQWIAKDTKCPVKTEVQIKMAMSSADLDLETDEEFTMTIDQRTNMFFYDYNKPVTIELPEEAESAVELPMFPQGNQTATTTA